MRRSGAGPRQSIRKLKRERPAGGAHHRHRLRGRRRKAAMFRREWAEVDRVHRQNDDKMRSESWRATPRPAFEARTRTRKIAGQRQSWRVREDGAAISSRAFRAALPRGPFVQVQNGPAEPPLHLLHHPVRPRQFALGPRWAQWVEQVRAVWSGMVHAEIRG